MMIVEIRIEQIWENCCPTFGVGVRVFEMVGKKLLNQLLQRFHTVEEAGHLTRLFARCHEYRICTIIITIIVVVGRVR